MDREENLKFIKKELDDLGLHDFPKKTILDLINSGKDVFDMLGEIQFPQYDTKEDMMYKIYFKKYEEPNLYHPYMHQVTLKNQPDKTRVFDFSKNEFFTLGDAFNLLHGRSLKKLSFDADSKKVESLWYQLDFNKKDEHGNVLMEKISNQDRNYVVSSFLNNYPIKELMNPVDRQNLLEAIYNGNAAPVTLLKDGMEVQGYVQASPKNNTVNVYSIADPVGLNSKNESTTKAITQRIPWVEVKAKRRHGRGV